MIIITILGMAVIVENLIVMDEKYFDYVKNDVQGYKGTFEIYKNPSEAELKKYIPQETRGFIDKDGNLYVVGWDEESYTDIDFKAPIHINLVKALYEKDPSIFDDVDPFSGVTLNQLYDEFASAYWIDSYGLNVALDGKKVYLGESNVIGYGMWEEPGLKVAIEIKYLKCKEKNPSFTFLMKTK